MDHSTTLTQCKAALLVPTGSTQSTTYQDACKINHLWRLALGIFPVDRTLSCTYVKEMARIATRSTLDIHFIQSCYCGHCHLIFVPGITCRVSQHKRSLSSQAYKRASRIAKHKHLETSEIAPFSEMVYTCNACNSTTSVCTSTRKNEGQKKARALGKSKEQRKRKATAKQNAAGSKKSKESKPKTTTEMNTNTAAVESSVPAPLPTSILSKAPRRKKKKKTGKGDKGTLGLGSFVNTF